MAICELGRCHHLDLGLPVSRTLRNKFVVFTTQSTVFFVIAA